jgi:hypothetical protein
MEEEFKAHGSYCISNAGGYLIELSDCGSMARVKDDYGSDNPEISDWFEIEFIESEDLIDEEGFPELESVIDPQGYNINLNNVMRI